MEENLGELLSLAKKRIEKHHLRKMKELNEIIKTLASCQEILKKYNDYIIMQRLQRVIRTYAEKFYRIRNIEIESFRQAIKKEDENDNR